MGVADEVDNYSHSGAELDKGNAQTTRHSALCNITRYVLSLGVFIS